MINVETAPAPVIGAPERVRVKLGANTNTSADTLATLARDGAVTVRAAVAMNPSTPADTDGWLAGDPDERVRALLARKLADLIGNSAAQDNDGMLQQAQASLARLAEDTAVRVRACIADALAFMPHAPRALILRLAHDCAISVSDPVLRLSPLLTKADLLSLLAAPPSPATAVSIAARPGLDPDVSDAVAASANTTAITALLSNPSAAIREATLDALIARAADQPAWHDPLVHRPRLSAAAARALAQFVAADLVATLAARADLDAEVADELARRLETLLQPSLSSKADDQDKATALTRAQQLQNDNALNEAVLVAAVQRGETRLAGAMLAVAADVAIAAVDRAITLRSAKGVVSLVWRAGFTMAVAVPLQILLARLGPDTVLRARSGSAFPLAVDEMRWQIEFLSGQVR